MQSKGNIYLHISAASKAGRSHGRRRSGTKIPDMQILCWKTSVRFCFPPCVCTSVWFGIFWNGFDCHPSAYVIKYSQILTSLTTQHPKTESHDRLQRVPVCCADLGILTVYQFILDLCFHMPCETNQCQIVPRFAEI